MTIVTDVTAAKIQARRAYSRGYAAGARGRWKEYDPPHPPQEQVLALFVAAKNLADAAAAVLNVVDADDGPDGPFVTLQTELGKVDAAFVTVSKWIKDATRGDAQLSPSFPITLKGDL